jgi:hypothetical protein
MATRPGFARPFIDAIVTDLRDKPQVASSTWMTTVAADHIPGFHQSSIEQLALNSPYEHPPKRVGDSIWRPAQLADPGGVDAGAAADLQAGAAALAEEVAQGAVDAEGSAFASSSLACWLARNSCSYHSAILS